MNHLLKDKRTAVIGAGPVGLTLARLLQQAGATVKVYERDVDSAARIWGGTLDLHKDSGQQALHKAGLLKKYYEESVPMGIHIADKTGSILKSVDLTPENMHDNPEINRNILRKILLESLSEDTVIWNRKLTDLKESNGEWQLSFENKPGETADVVIIANGGNSKLRSYVNDTAIEETGTFILQGDVPQPKINCPDIFRLCGGKRLMTAANGNLLVINPLNNGSLTYGLIFRRPEEWSRGIPIDFNHPEAAADFLCLRLRDWDKVYHQLFRATSFFVGLPTRKLPVGHPWKDIRPLPITLVGDAAHLMPPFAGQGVNIGLSDALHLSENLTEGDFKTIEEAIADYERKMFVYAEEAQDASSENELKMRDPAFSFATLMNC